MNLVNIKSWCPCKGMSNKICLPPDVANHIAWITIKKLQWEIIVQKFELLNAAFITALTTEIQSISKVIDPKPKSFKPHCLAFHEATVFIPYAHTYTVLIFLPKKCTIDITFKHTCIRFPLCNSFDVVGRLFGPAIVQSL